MRTLVVYESMFGTTRRLAQVIASAIRTEGSSVDLTPAADAPRDVSGYDLVVLGAPTHAHSLPRPTSRTEAAAWAADPRKSLALEAGADLPGVREWIEAFEASGTHATFAAYSTRVDMPRIFAGDATASMTRLLRGRGADVGAHADFLVDRSNQLLDGEAQRARDWATQLPSGRVSSTVL